ncbi:hypothetical protein JIN85_18460 [Luteolibacter pohnpeiensis]|uniref:Uncharacterized protein n=1 Tax=Luteolibacter pohnpeiensis TaxID=454153 RepID=A0A934VSK4_9BACT|nr:hypothetical protein [Luteolibacter pohnpeiensis]MBK1884406.1 hypothetical protein [Luteolibacter pohnpeiensis]
MSAFETLESVAALLPPPQRERFLTMAARFRNVPEDDEYLQVLEAIGFMTLLWKEVPEKIQRTLAGASPTLGCSEQFISIMRDAVTSAIPSYEDLKQIAQRLEAHEQLLARMARHTSTSDKPEHTKRASILWVGVGVILGLGIPELIQFINS